MIVSTFETCLNPNSRRASHYFQSLKIHTQAITLASKLKLISPRGKSKRWAYQKYIGWSFWREMIWLAEIRDSRAIYGASVVLWFRAQSQGALRYQTPGGAIQKLIIWKGTVNHVRRPPCFLAVDPIQQQQQLCTTKQAYQSRYQRDARAVNPKWKWK